jgi:hypothetical protein
MLALPPFGTLTPARLRLATPLPQAVEGVTVNLLLVQLCVTRCGTAPIPGHPLYRLRERGGEPEASRGEGSKGGEGQP